MNDKTPKTRLADKIKSVNNILITVSRNPSVDQLAATLGLTLALNKMGKRSVAVFSGKIPPAINFLEPEKTFESNADSLRDFIISLDKDKADRLKCKADGDFVKVFITPYRTKITTDDLKFEEGDFNIELVIAIGVSNREELDVAIASHGKIFHDAIVATLNLNQGHDGLGSISWQDAGYNCYSEMCASLTGELAVKQDEAIATAYLTGVVSATEQFRNDKTSPAIMTLAADLMSKGANQQLISSELSHQEELEVSNLDAVVEKPAPAEPAPEPDTTNIGELSVNHAEPTPAPVVNEPPKPDLVKIENDRLAENRSQDAIALAESQLSEAELAEQAAMAAEVQRAAASSQMPASSQPPLPRPVPVKPMDQLANTVEQTEPIAPAMSAGTGQPVSPGVYRGDPEDIAGTSRGNTAAQPANDVTELAPMQPEPAPAPEPNLANPLPPAKLAPPSQDDQLSHGMPYVEESIGQPLTAAVAGDAADSMSNEDFTSKAPDIVPRQPNHDTVPAFRAANQVSPIPPAGSLASNTSNMNMAGLAMPPATSDSQFIPSPDIAVPLPPPPPVPDFGQPVLPADNSNNLSPAAPAQPTMATPTNMSLAPAAPAVANDPAQFVIPS